MELGADVGLGQCIAYTRTEFENSRLESEIGKWNCKDRAGRSVPLLTLRTFVVIPVKLSQDHCPTHGALFIFPRKYTCQSVAWKISEGYRSLLYISGIYPPIPFA
jgi:hypothetical protein